MSSMRQTSSVSEKEIIATEKVSTQSKIDVWDVTEGEMDQIQDGDLALKIAVEAQEYELTPEEDKKLLRKTDMFICSIMSFVYAIQYMDKQTNSYASIMGLREDLNMVGNDYSWVGTCFYLGYMVFVFPNSLFLQRFPVAKVSGCFIILWGFVLCMSSIPNTYAGFIVTRTILGVTESGVTPAFVLFTSQWYKREEQFLRTAIWSASCGIGTIVGALISHGLVDNNNLPIVAWRLLYIILGVITIGLGFLFMVIIPDIPSKAWFLNKEEKLLIVQRIRKNKQGFGNRHFKWYQAKEAFTDVRTYVYFFCIVAAEIPNGGIGSFGSIMLTDMGYANDKALLMGTPQGAVEFFGIITVAYISQRLGNRMPAAIFSYLLNILAACLLAFPSSTHAQLAGYYLLGMATLGWTSFMSCVSSNTAGHTKKVITSAVCMVAYCVGNLIGPQTFRANEAPNYRGAKVAIVVCFCVCLFLSIFLYWYNVSENKRRDSLGLKLSEVENSEFADLTDFENPAFRYAI